MFVLDKWYLDLVTADGAAFIGYSAALRWIGLRLRFQAYLYSPPDGPAEERVTLRRSAAPTANGDEIVWRCPALEVSGHWTRAGRRLRARLHHGERGSVLWLCHQPRARARVTMPDGRLLAGEGYVERLRVTVPPARLPLDTLHWGRFHGASETVVWIEWQRGTAGRWIFRNGIRQVQARISGAAVIDLEDRACLRFAGLRPLRERRVLPALAAVPGLGRRTAGRIASLHETKWIGRGVLHRPGGDDTEGWLIHEEVSWRGQPG